MVVKEIFPNSCWYRFITHTCFLVDEKHGKDCEGKRDARNGLFIDIYFVQHYWYPEGKMIQDQSKIWMNKLKWCKSERMRMENCVSLFSCKSWIKLKPFFVSSIRFSGCTLFNMFDDNFISQSLFPVILLIHLRGFFYFIRSQVEKKLFEYSTAF